MLATPLMCSCGCPVRANAESPAERQKRHSGTIYAGLHVAAGIATDPLLLYLDLLTYCILTCRDMMQTAHVRSEFNAKRYI